LELEVAGLKQLVKLKNKELKNVRELGEEMNNNCVK